MKVGTPQPLSPPAIRSNGRAAREPLRLLVLAPFAPRFDATHGGGRVIAQLLSELAARHQIALCYLRAAHEPALDACLHERCAVVEEVVLPDAEATALRRWRHKVRVWSGVLAGKPLWAVGRSAGAFGRRVAELARDWRPNVVQLEYHIMGQYLPALAGCPAPRVLVEHEPGREAAFELWRARQTRGRLMPHLDLLAWQRFEAAVVRQVQAVVVFTERDQRALERLRQPTPVTRIRLGTPLPEEPLDPLGQTPPSLLFVGNFEHAPNTDAAWRLVRDIYPRLRADVPDLGLHIVGSHPPASLQRAGHPRLVVTGYVPDVRPYLNRATVVVMPLRLGGGMRVKVLEALAAGKAVVASPLAVEGLALEDGRHVLLAGSDEGFVEAIKRLLKDTPLRARLAREAHAWAAVNLGWAEPVKQYQQLYERLLSGQNRF